MKETILSWQGWEPEIAKNVFIAPGAYVIGQVKIGSGSSIWFNCVLRGDVAPIVIGSNSNIQDGCVLHGAHIPTITPIRIGSNVTIGHKSIIHACSIGNDAFIGMGSIILSSAKIGRGTLVAAGSLVLEGSSYPPGVVIMGAPAKIIRDVTEEEREMFKMVTLTYKERASKYMDVYSCNQSIKT
ncbi:gamma carbonic anhydrase family protein [Desulfotomaculum copahuensis]|uniref:gamma carbonic anhydrase family protein n=1 Tax=Desulfotomaculum copahuensis TaxID=1838280 RepID=UPI00098EDEE1|nr:gamma carbonic anhydrase family protein [Desulfotomaculum copahuensis]